MSPLLLSRLHFVFVPISSMSSLQISPIHSNPFPPSVSAVSTLYSPRYLRQCLPYSIDDTLPNSAPLSLILNSVFPTFPSAVFNFLSRRLHQCTLVLRRLLLILLGSLSVPSHSIRLSQCRLLCPYVSYTDVCVTVVDDSFVSPFSPFRPFFSLQLFNTCRIRVVNAILFCSFTGSRSRRVCSHLLSDLSPTS